MEIAADFKYRHTGDPPMENNVWSTRTLRRKMLLTRVIIRAKCLIGWQRNAFVVLATRHTFLTVGFMYLVLEYTDSQNKHTGCAANFMGIYFRLLPSFTYQYRKRFFLAHGIRALGFRWKRCISSVENGGVLG